MKEDNQQTVANDDNAVAPQTAEESSAQAQENVDNEPSLEDLLKEFSEGSKSPQQDQQDQDAQQQKVIDTEKRLEALETHLQNAEYKTDMNKLVDGVRGDLPSDKFDDTFIEAWVHSVAANNKSLQDAWDNRQNDPKGFSKIVSKLGKDFASKYGDLGADKNTSEDVAAVADAIRGGKADTQQAQPTYGTLNDNQFAKDVEDKYGFNPMI